MKKQIVAPGSIPRIAGVIVLFGVVALGAFYGLPLAVLGMATAALGLVVALLWASVSSLAGETELSVDEALSYGSPSSEEEQKLAVLRALKDLEFERSVGKISEEDYREFSARYRAEAKRLIARVDESLAETRRLAEDLASERIRKSGVHDEGRKPLAEGADGSADKRDEAADVSARPPPEAPAAPSKELSCPSCKTSNDVDARFCKHCGKTLKSGEAVSGSTEENIA